MNIADLSVAILRDVPVPTDNRQLCALVTLTADDGTVGYGEANANPAAVKALLDTDLGLTDNWDDIPRSLVIGADVTQPRQLTERLRESTFWSCRAGLGHVALAAIITAAWDLAGKIAGQPTYHLMGDLRNPRPKAYCTLYHGRGAFPDVLKRTLDAADQALQLGFRAIKVEPLPENAPEQEDIVELVRAVRHHVGDDVTLLADVGYRWSHPEQAIPVARRLDEFSLFALEAPFPPADVAAYRSLAAAISTPLCTGDQLTAAVEYLPVLDSGAVAFVQGGAARTGLADMDRLARHAATVGKQFVSWGWVATAQTISANVHLTLGHNNIPLVEYAPPQMYPEANLRNRLFNPEPHVVDGVFDIPTAPGLGLELDQDIFNRLRVG